MIFESHHKAADPI